MAEPVQAMETPAAPQNWKATLKLPPKDARIRTEVSQAQRVTSASWLLMACQPCLAGTCLFTDWSLCFNNIIKAAVSLNGVANTLFPTRT